MDLNGDGNLDILSGSYSRQDKDMAGLFQVLWGNEDGTFQKAKVLLGSDGEPLILPAPVPAPEGDDHVTHKICTRPFACDLNGDGKLDIVAGNFSGTFGLFVGEGGGKFAPKATWLQADGQPMRVENHGDPFLIDWDGDGDLDLLSGSSAGGAFLFSNAGSKQAPKFGAKVTLFSGSGHKGYGSGEEIKFGEAHCTAPAQDTRVWAADVDSDGKLDLLIGDQISVCHPAKGVDEQTARTQLADWTKEQVRLLQANQAGMDDADQKKWQDSYQKLHEERAKIVKDEMTGFVWLLRQK